jgi:hypothetical protein
MAANKKSRSGSENGTAAVNSSNHLKNFTLLYERI